MRMDVEGATAEVTKTMAADPRRISGIKLCLTFPTSYDDKAQEDPGAGGKDLPCSLQFSSRY